MTKPLKDTLLAGMAKARQNIKEADDNLSLGNLDNSVSSSYYAAFTAARVMLMTLGIEPKSHAGVRGMVALHFVKPGLLTSELGRVLRDLKEARETGDYDFFSGTSADEAKEFLSEAKQFMTAAEDYLQPFLKQ